MLQAADINAIRPDSESMLAVGQCRYGPMMYLRRDQYVGRSLQEYLRARLVELARQPDAEALIQRIHARKDATGSSLPGDRILSHRDEDRR